MQEIGPRFTLKLRTLRKGLPAVKNLGEVKKPLEFDTFDTTEDGVDKEESAQQAEVDDNEPMDAEPTAEPPVKEKQKTLPPKEDQYDWVWKVSCVS